MRKLRGLFILDESAYELIYGPAERRDIAAYVDVVAPPQTRLLIAQQMHLLGQIDVLFSGWGAPLLDDAFLDAAPNLKAVFYGAGAVGYIMTQSVWDRGIVLTSAYAANAQPVAEYSLATILFSLKHGWSLTRQTRQTRTFPPRDGAPGCYRRTVGIVSLGMCGRTLLKLLRPFDLKIIAFDPFVSEEEAAQLGVQLCSLKTLFAESDVVSVHAPDLEETEGMIDGQMLASMKHGATFINTARGIVVKEDEMISVLSRRPDLQAVLDVSEPEPPDPNSPLFTLPNVLLTPHIAGSVGQECTRMGRYMVEELRRYVRGEPLKWAITRDLAARSSHRPVVSVKVNKRLASKSGAVVA
jgi:phosphoglycerate dehydrogenase-like enzyme